MNWGKLFLCLLLAAYQLQLAIPNAAASGSSSVVIEQMYPGATGTATQEFVELYNNATQPVDVTGWCVSYVSSSGSSTTKLGCLSAPDNTTRLWVKAGGYVTFVSNEYKAAQSATADVSFTGGLSPTAGHIKLFDSSNTEIDKLGWGAATSPETTAATAPANGKSLQRKSTAGGYQDTDNNAADFQAVTPVLHTSDVYEVVTIVDVCPNVVGVQVTMPGGYLADVNGNCQPDSCLNIDGLQVSVPDQYDADVSGNCTPHDECENVTGVQLAIPSNMIRSGINDCVWNIAPLVLNEVLPNAVGSDTGNEFIEIYNPTNQTIDLSLYSVKIGVNSDKTYAFPIGVTIAPGEYRSFSDSIMKFTLVNTSSRVLLTAVDGSTLGDSGIYDSPAEGESWAVINGSWQYTNRPTPGSENTASASDEGTDQTDTTQAACPAGKYRNPLTNRCRTITADASILAACDADQYRNPETGRCRKIEAAASLTPCKDGQYRSEETNRCRNIVTASAQKPCKDNQYRSEETNRCRTLPAATVPDAAFAVQPVKDTSASFIGWWALGGVGLLAVGYAIWEWRREIAVLWRRVINQ